MKMSPQYSRLAAAIDSQEMRKRIRPQLGRIKNMEIELEDFNISRVFPRSNNGFTIQYRMKVLIDKSESSRPMILCGYLLGENEEWPEYIQSNKQQVIVFEDLRLIIPVFPFDPHLPAIVELCVKGEIPPTIQKGASDVIADLSNAGIVDFEILGYRLEKRCVIRHILGQSGKEVNHPKMISIVTKIARPGKMKEIRKCQTLLQQNGFFGAENNGSIIPVTYHIDIKAGIQISESAPGETLHSLTGNKRFPLACEEAASLLRKLHKVDSSSLTKYSIKGELTNLDEKIRLISSVFPEFASSFESAFESIKSSSRQLDDKFETACVHRDFYDKQILYSAERSTLLDCDSLACGDPAQDCGNFIAHMILRRLQEPANVPIIDRGIKVFTSVYGNANRYFEVRASWWQAATLLRLAFLYSLRPKWHELTSSLLSYTFANVQGNQTQMEGVNDKYLW